MLRPKLCVPHTTSANAIMRYHPSGELRTINTKPSMNTMVSAATTPGCASEVTAGGTHSYVVSWPVQLVVVRRHSRGLHPFIKPPLSPAGEGGGFVTKGL